MKMHFRFAEMLYSARAQQQGIDNFPPASQPYIIDNIINTMRELECVRLTFQNPIIVTSGYRCPELNALVGGADNSQHMKGEAADITASRKALNLELARLFLRSRRFDQLILEHCDKDGVPQWLHVSYKRDGVNRQQWWRTDENGDVIKNSGSVEVINS